MFLQLRPWQLSEVSELKFKQDLNDQKKVDYQVQPRFEIRFPKALTYKRKYFKSLIDVEAIEFLNHLHRQVGENINANAKKYHVQMALTRTLHSKLRDTAEVILAQKYTQEQFDPKFGALETDSLVSDGAFILFYLKHQLVRLVLEIQESFGEQLKEEPLTEDDVYLLYFNHSAPDPSCLIKATPLPISSISQTRPSLPESEDFKVCTGDFREVVKGVHRYQSIIKTPKRFASFEEKLYQNGYIDAQYKFVDKHGMKQEMAAIYHQLIRKGYFHERTYDPIKQVKDLDIRKFLDHRYQTDLDKQFRFYRKESEKLVQFIDSHYWLSNLDLG